MKTRSLSAGVIKRFYMVLLGGGRFKMPHESFEAPTLCLDWARSYGNEKTNIELPAAASTYCFPSTPYVIGLARTELPSGTCQSGSPSVALSAKKLPSASAQKTRLPAVTSVPVHESPTILNCHFRSPVVASSARTAL